MNANNNSGGDDQNQNQNNNDTPGINDINVLNEKLAEVEKKEKKKVETLTRCVATLKDSEVIKSKQDPAFQKLVETVTEAFEELKTDSSEVISSVNQSSNMIMAAACKEIGKNTQALNEQRDVLAITSAVVNSHEKQNETLYDRLRDMMAEVALEQARQKNYLKIRQVPENETAMSKDAGQEAEAIKIANYINKYVLKDPEGKPVTKNDIMYVSRQGQFNIQRQGPRPLNVHFKSTRMVDDILVACEIIRNDIANKTDSNEAFIAQLNKELPYPIDAKQIKATEEFINKGMIAQHLANASLPESHPQLALFNRSRCTISLSNKRQNQGSFTGKNSRGAKIIADMIAKNQKEKIAAAWRFLMTTGRTDKELMELIVREDSDVWNGLGIAAMRRWCEKSMPEIVVRDKSGADQYSYIPKGDLDAEAMMQERKTPFQELFPQPENATRAYVSKQPSGKIFGKQLKWFAGSQFKQKIQMTDIEVVKIYKGDSKKRKGDFVPGHSPEMKSSKGTDDQIDMETEEETPDNTESTQTIVIGDDTDEEGESSRVQIPPEPTKKAKQKTPKPPIDPKDRRFSTRRPSNPLSTLGRTASLERLDSLLAKSLYQKNSNPFSGMVNWDQPPTNWNDNAKEKPTTPGPETSTADETQAEGSGQENQ